MHHASLIALATAALLCCAGTARANNTVSLYGSVDQYLNYMASSSGARIKSLQDGGFVRSRIGFKGEEALGQGFVARFQLESGLTADTGAQADSNRFFERLAWVGVSSTSWGEVRVGRQGSVVQSRGDAVDFTGRNLGSVVKAFGEPSRYDNDVSWLSPRIKGLQLEAHVALGESPQGLKSQLIYQFAADYTRTPWRVGYGGIRGKAPANAVVKQQAVYDNLFVNYGHGGGQVYLVYARSNNNTASSAGNNTAMLLGGTTGLVAGTSLDAQRYFNIWQLSADHKIGARWRVGALVGRIHDTSGDGRHANGAALGAFYALSGRTTLYGLTETLNNEGDAGFRPVGSASLNPNFAGDDVNGRRISGVQLGVFHRF